MKKKADIIYIIMTVLCLALLIGIIELKPYFAQLQMSYGFYFYPLIMTNLAGPFIVCLMIVFRQSHHQRAMASTKIVTDLCSAVVFIIYNFFLFRYRFMPEVQPESLILLCLFIVPAVYNIYQKFHSKISNR